MTWGLLWYRIVLLVRVNITSPISHWWKVRQRARHIRHIRAEYVKNQTSYYGRGLEEPVGAGVRHLPVAYQHLGAYAGSQAYQRDRTAGAMLQQGLANSSIGMNQLQMTSAMKQAYFDYRQQQNSNNFPAGLLAQLGKRHDT